MPRPRCPRASAGRHPHWRDTLPTCAAPSPPPCHRSLIPFAQVTGQDVWWISWDKECGERQAPIFPELASAHGRLFPWTLGPADRSRAVADGRDGKYHTPSKGGSRCCQPETPENRRPEKAVTRPPTLESCHVGHPKPAGNCVDALAEDHRPPHSHIHISACLIRIPRCNYFL